MITWLLSFALQACAAEPVALNELVKVTAITQFVDAPENASVQKIESSGARSNLVFQTPLYEGDRVETTAGQTLKIAARNGCTFVLRGDGTLASPVASKPWRMRASSLRVICRGRSNPETLGIANLPLVIQNGEILFVNRQLILIDGAASYAGQKLSLKKLYVVEGSSTQEASPQPNESDLRAFNVAEKPPRESASWAAVEQPKIYRSRFMIGPVAGGDGVIYDNVDYAQGGLRGGGARLQFQFKRANETSLIVALTSREASKSSDSSYNSPPADGPQNTLEHHSLEIGLRQKHDSWWSPFVRAGLTAARAKIGYSQTNTFGGSSYSRYGYEFYLVNATWGMDAHLHPQFLKPFGFYVSAEATAYTSFHRGARENLERSGFSQTTPDEPWRLTGFDVLASAGLDYSF